MEADVSAGQPHLAVAALDRLLLQRRITGYTVEADVSYITARIPTLTYRVYDDRPGLHHLNRFLSDMRPLQAEVSVCPGTGNLHDEAVAGSIRRTPQLTASVRFGGRKALESAIRLVRTRYHGLQPGAVRGSWLRPDVRVTGCRTVTGMVAVTAHCFGLQGPGAVTMTLEGQPPIPGLPQMPVWVLEDWLPFLAGCRTASELG